MDGMNEETSRDYVYILSAENVFYKIGITNNLSSRIDYLRTGCPYSISYANIFQYNRRDAFIVEKYLHTLYKEYRKSGEWFLLPNDALDFLKSQDSVSLLDLAKESRKESRKKKTNTDAFDFLDEATLFDMQSTTPPKNNRGRRPMSEWVKARDYLANPLLRDGNWYEMPLDGMSIGYARRQANRRGFTTAVDNSVLKVCVPAK